jgi:hypothetical protein
VITNAGSACGTPRWTRHERRPGELACTAGSSPPMTSSTSSTHQPRQPHRRHLPVINQCASDPKPCRGSVHGWRRHLRPVIQHRHHDGRGVLRPAHRSNRPATGRRSPLRRSAETCSTIPTRASAPAAVGQQLIPGCPSATGTVGTTGNADDRAFGCDRISLTTQLQDGESNESALCPAHQPSERLVAMTDSPWVFLHREYSV